MNFILNFTILAFNAHGGEIEFVPLETTNYRYSTSLFTKIQHDLNFINHYIYAHFLHYLAHTTMFCHIKQN
jgi:hypothetical protein